MFWSKRTPTAKTANHKNSTHKTSSRWRLLASASLLATVLGAGASHAADSVTLRIDWTLQGFHLPFVWALDKGYYAAEGLDVKILEGRGSGNVAQVVASKGDTFGQLDAGAGALARSKGAPIKIIATYLQKTQGALVSFKATGINKPEDVIGKTVATSQGSTSGNLFRAFLKSNKIAEDKVKMQSVDSHAKMATLLQGKVDAITGLVTAECVEIALQSSKPVNCMHLSEYGVKALSIALAAHEDTLRDKPDLVKRFVKATNRGWEESVKHPAEAAKIGKKHFPLAEEHLLKAKFEQVGPLMHTDATMGKPTGWMAQSDWEGTISVLKELAGMKSTEPVTAFYTNDFIPAK
jgi:NitT/TauT family transport system substrate-binding protein